MTKMIGIGTVLKCSTAGTTTYGLTIGQVQSITRSGLSVQSIETHTLDDAPNMTFAPGFIDPGELSIVTTYDPGTTATAHAALNSLLLNRVTAKWKLILPTTTLVEEFDGFLTGVERPIEKDGRIDQTFSVKLTGAPGLTT